MRAAFPTRLAGKTARLIVLVISVAALGQTPAAAHTAVRTLTFSYRSHAGAMRIAYVVLPAWYGPRRHPPIPLVISPHGRGVSGAYNLRFWGTLPARGPFALVSPDGQGRRLPLYSWGFPGQIDDLARMPSLVHSAFPWLDIARHRIFAIGDSMGGQEVLLMLAAHRGLRLAGVAAFDPVTDMAARYRAWQVTPGEHRLPALARIEFGGTPTQLPEVYAARSPATSVVAIARTGITLQLWWSRRDAVITDQVRQTEDFYRRVIALAPSAPVQEIVGYWQHAREMHADAQLPAALACFHLIPTADVRVPAYTTLPGSGGAIAERPPRPVRPDVPLSPAFCGRTGR